MDFETKELLETLEKYLKYKSSDGKPERQELRVKLEQLLIKVKNNIK